MDISKWGLNKIMRLPDWCFGRRWIVSCSIINTDDALVWDISELEMPNVGVVWSVGIFTETNFYIDHNLRLGLGDQIPATNAEMMTLDPLIPGMGLDGPEPRLIVLPQEELYRRYTSRYGVNFAGRRLVVEFAKAAQVQEIAEVTVEVSGIPSEVPDWLAKV